MKIEMVSPSEIKPYFNNPRKNQNAVLKVAESIQAFGFNQPIVVDSDMVIIVGHTRWKAALKLGLPSIPIIKTNLDKAKAKAYRIADNKVSEYSEWDYEKLVDELDALNKEIDLALTGFDQSELDDLLSSDEDTEQDIDQETETPEIEFAEELREEHNYIVLYFDNEVDWLQAKSIFDLKPVKPLHAKPGFESKSVGRVLNGATAIEKLKESVRYED